MSWSKSSQIETKTWKAFAIGSVRFQTLWIQTESIKTVWKCHKLPKTDFRCMLWTSKISNRLWAFKSLQASNLVFISKGFLFQSFEKLDTNKKRTTDEGKEVIRKLGKINTRFGFKVFASCVFNPRDEFQRQFQIFTDCLFRPEICIHCLLLLLLFPSTVTVRVHCYCC